MPPIQAQVSTTHDHLSTEKSPPRENHSADVEALYSPAGVGALQYPPPAPEENPLCPPPKARHKALHARDARDGPHGPPAETRDGPAANRARPILLISVPKPCTPPLDVDAILRPRIEKHDGRRAANAARAAVLDSQGAYHLSRELEACGQVVVFSISDDGQEVIETRTSGGLFCNRPRVCRICAPRRTGRLVDSYWGRIVQCFIDDKDETLFPVMCVLTQRAGDDLNERLEHLGNGLTRLLDRRRRAFQFNRHHSELTNVTGGVFSIEVKRGKGSRLWHVHAHALFLQRDYMNAKAFRREWADCIGQKRANVFLKRIARDDKETWLEGMPKELCEVFKYNVKLGDVDDVEALDVFRAVSGKRLLRPFGILKGVHLQTDNEPAPFEGREFVVVAQPDEGRYEILEWPCRRE